MNLSVSVTAEIFLICTNVTRTNVAWTNVKLTVGICLRCSQEPIVKVSSNQVLRYSWYGQISRGQILPGQMSPWQLESVLDVPRNLSLKFHQNRVINSCKVILLSNPTIVLRLGWGFDKNKKGEKQNSTVHNMLSNMLHNLQSNKLHNLFYNVLHNMFYNVLHNT